MEWRVAQLTAGFAGKQLEPASKMAQPRALSRQLCPPHLLCAWMLLHGNIWVVQWRTLLSLCGCPAPAVPFVQRGEVRAGRGMSEVATRECNARGTRVRRWTRCRS